MTAGGGQGARQLSSGIARCDGGRVAMPLWHVALSVGDMQRTYHWYHQTLGLTFARSVELLAGPLFTWTVGVRRAASTCWWINDRQDLFQLELFQFQRPPTRALPGDWRPCDIGYTGISFHVDDLDATLRRAERCGSPPHGPVVGQPGARRACVRDPDGVLIELMEEDPRDTAPRARPRELVPAVARSVTLSVADLRRSRELFVSGLGLREATDVVLHRPEHEAMWGLAGAARDSVLLWADDFLVELVSYNTPRPAPRRASYRISDRGVFHICFGALDYRQFRRVLEQCREAGSHGNSPAFFLAATAGLYIVDEQGFTVELLYRHRWFRQSTGAAARAAPLPSRRASKRARHRRRGRFATAIVIAPQADIGGELCRLLADDGTSLWLVDPRGVDAEWIKSRSSKPAEVEVRCVSSTQLRPLLPAPQEAGPGPTLVLDLSAAAPASQPARARPFEVLSSLIGHDGAGVQHVTVVADARARAALAALHSGLAAGPWTSTIATVARPRRGPLSRPPLRRIVSITSREAAEAIYRATLRRRSRAWSLPGAWPPRRGASEAATLGDPTLLPLPAGGGRQARPTR